MPHIKLPLAPKNYERLVIIAAARPNAPTLPNLAIEALNKYLQLDPPLPLSKGRGNPGTSRKGIQQPPGKKRGVRRPKAELHAVNLDESKE